MMGGRGIQVEMKKSDSERERLLRLIDSGGKPGRPMKYEDRSAEPSPKFLKMLTFPRAGIKTLPPMAGAYVNPAQGMSLVTKSLLVVLVILIGYGIVDLLAQLIIVKMPMPVVTMDPVRSSGNPPLPVEPVKQYADTITRSDVFNPQRITDAPAENPVEQPGISGALKLVGIDWDNEPVAMIEDVQSGKTYFAKEDTFIKDIKVVKIQPDKVTINRGNTIEEIK